MKGSAKGLPGWRVQSDDGSRPSFPPVRPSNSPDPAAAPPQARRPDIQGLRAVAVLAVVAYHAGLPVPGGFVGVDVFFVISGFVITGMLSREWLTSGRIAFGPFYLRRFKRLTPALAVMVVLTLIISVALVSPLGPQQTAGITAVGAMLLAANFAIARFTGGYFDAKADTNPLLHTWSLSVEEQFYLVFPIVLACAWIVARRWRIAFAPLIAVSAVAVVSFTLAVGGSAGWSIPGIRGFLRTALLGFYSPATRAWEFAAGALLALLVAHRPPRSRRLSSVCGVIGLGLLAFSVMAINQNTPFPGVWALPPVVGTLLLLAAGSGASPSSPRALSNLPMVRIGDWSYSIYLWHWPLIVFAGLVWHGSAVARFAAAVASIVPAVLSYRWVENPVRGLRGLSPLRNAGLVAAVVIPPIMVASALYLSAAQGWWSERVQRLQAGTLTASAATLRRCESPLPFTNDQISRCTWNGSATGRPIYVLGDSNAAHFSDGFIQAAGDVDRPLVVRARNGCPFIDLIVTDPAKTDSANTSCHAYVQDALAYLKRAENGLVVISNGDAYWPDNGRWNVGPSQDDMSTDSSRKIAAFETALRATAAALAADGHDVLLVQTAIPPWIDGVGRSAWDPARCDLRAIIEDECVADFALADVLSDKEQVRSVVTEVARDTGAGVWDALAAVCPEGICSTESPAFTRYHDQFHISVAQSVALAPDIRENIGAHR